MRNACPAGALRCLLLAGEIEQMEQGAFIDAVGGEILDHHRAGRERPGNIGLVEQARGQDAGARKRRPDRRKVTLAGALGPDERHHRRRPVRPALDERQSGLVGRSGQEIVARETLGMVERENELARPRQCSHGI